MDNNTQRVRAFIAISLPNEVSGQLAQLQNALRSHLGTQATAVRWVRPQQFHLTLRFLGDIAEDRAADVEATIVRACHGVAPLHLDITQAGCFPHTRNPRVIRVGIGGEVDRLQAIQTGIEHAVGALRKHSENSTFHPHLTLGRIKTTNRQTVRCIGKVIESVNMTCRSEWMADRVVLMRSELSVRGSTYTELASITLAAAH